ncbi:hypothetical protein Hanom_Chr12g01078631 [Helianthus anomalus]
MILLYHLKTFQNTSSLSLSVPPLPLLYIRACLAKLIIVKKDFWKNNFWKMSF